MLARHQATGVVGFRWEECWLWFAVYSLTDCCLDCHPDCCSRCCISWNRDLLQIFNLKEIKFWKIGEYTRLQRGHFVLYSSGFCWQLRLLCNFCEWPFEVLANAFMHYSGKHMKTFISQYTFPLDIKIHLKLFISQCMFLLNDKKSHECPVWEPEFLLAVENQMDIFCGNLYSDWSVYYNHIHTHWKVQNVMTNYRNLYRK